MNSYVLPYMTSRETYLVADLTSEESEQVSLFKERSERLFVSQEKYQNIPMVSYGREEDGRITNIEMNTPEFDSIINLAINFRFFYAQKESTNFGTFLNFIRQRAKDEWAVNYLDHIRKNYNNSMRSKNGCEKFCSDVDNRKVIDLWFNSDFFHSNPKKRIALKDLNQKVGEEISLFQLYSAILNCSTYIQMVYSVVHKLDKKNRIICTPNHHFRASNN